MDLGKDKGDPGDADKSSVPLSDPIMASTIPGPHPPPSPLSGCYLLVVLPEPHTAQHKDLILNRVAKGFLSWDKDSVHVDLEKELQALVAQSPEGEEARNGERLIQYATENLVTEILIHPQINTLLQCIRNLLASFTKHRHIIHAGYTFGENGSWILQDGTFSVADFLDAFSEHDVQRVLHAYENSITVDINCCEIGEWSTKRFTKEQCTRSCRVRLNPDDILTRDLSAIINFTKYIEQYLVPQTLDELMKPSDVVGNIRFSHPTLYVFPGGQGDAALFGINGFNMLVDGGFSRKSCFWDFTRHLDRLDAVLLTRINNSNAVGMSSILKKKHDMHVYPQIGHFFCNLVERKNNDSSTNNYDDPLILSLTKIGQDMMLNLKHINLQPHPCYRHPDPINLYHKVGHGTLDMYVLSPNKDSREVREFLTKWRLGDCKIFENSHKKDNNIINFPIQNMISICALLIWQPANPNDTITRILFPGSTPQNKIFEGMEKLKHLEFLKYSTCTAKTISSSSTSLTTSTIIQGIKDTNNKPIKHKLASLERDTTTTTTATTKRYSSNNSNNNITEMRKQKRETKIETNDKVEKVHEKSDKIIDVKSTKKSMTNENNKKIDTNIDENKTNKLIIEKKDKELKKTEITKTEKTGIKDTTTTTTKISSNKNDKKGKDDSIKEQQQQLPQRFITGKTGETKIISDKKIKDKPITKKDTTRSNITSTKQEQQKMTSSTTTATTKSTVKSSTKTFSAAPKSTKDANNRKVLEQKNNEKTSTTMTSRATSVKQKPAAAPIASEKKPVPRRPKPAAASPSKTRTVTGSPIKSVKNAVVHRTEKDSAIRRIKTDKGIIDTSTTSTPSAIEPDSLIKYTDKCLTEKSEDMSLDSIESKVLADMKEERQVVEEIEAVLQKAERIEGAQKIDDEVTVDITGDKKDLTEDMTEDDVTADIDEIPIRKSPTSKVSHEQFTEDDDEYLIIEKEEIYTEDSVQSGDHEKKHYLDAVESEKIKVIDKKIESEEEFDGDDEEESGAEEKEVAEEKGIIEDREKSIELSDKKAIDEKIKSPIVDDDKQNNIKDIISSTNETIQKSDDKDDSGKKDSDDLKEITSLSPEKLDSSEKKTDTDIKPDIDLKMKEKLEESQERISTIESGQTTTAPTLPEDERISVDVIKPTTIEKPILEDKKIEITKPKEIVPLTSDIPQEIKPDIKTFNIRQTGNVLQRDIVKTPDEVADLPVHEEVDPHLYKVDDDFEKPKEEKTPPSQPDVKSTPTAQDVKVPSPKEQKGFQSFFGSIADKFEKGMDKLTGKTRGDSDKDIDEKSSPKSGSPKEDKRQIPIVPDTPADHTQIVSEEIKKGELSPQKSPVDDQIKQKELHIEEKSKDIPKTVEAPEDLEEVEALIEEASKKFKTVKDSLHDSLESLEDKLAEEEFKRSKEMAENIKDEIQGTLDEVVGKLEQIRPEFEIPKESDETKLADGDSTKVLQDKNEEEEEEESDIPFKNVKGAVLDVGGVLAGTAGILIEEKPKDVVEIVKKVAEVLSEDDFLSDKILFKDGDDGKTVEKSMDKKSPEQTEIQEELCRKKSSAGIADLASPSKEKMTDKDAAKAMCKDLLKKDIIMTKPSDDIHDYGVDVVTAGIEEVCHKVQLPEPEEKPSTEFDPSEIIMEHKKAPDTAEHVIVSPDSQPPSPKYPIDKIQSKSDEKDEIETVISHHENITEIIEELVFVKNKKITIEIIEYIRVIKRVTREHVIDIIEDIILKKNIPRNCVVDDGVLDDESIEHEDEIEASIASEKLLADIEAEIINEYVMKNKKITKTTIEEIHIRRKIPIRIVIEIIESIVIMRKIRRQSIVDVADTVWNELKSTVEIESDLEDEQDDKEDDKIPEKIDIDSSIIGETTRTNIEQEIVTEHVDKQKKITEAIIEEIHTRHKIPMRIVIEIIEHILIIRKIPRHSIVDVADADWNVMKNSNEYKVKPEEKENDKSIVSEAIKSEIESIIMNEYIRHEKKITANNIEEIHMKKNIPIKIIIEVIEKITITKKIPRKSIVDFSEKIWEELKASKPLTIDTKEEEKELLDSFVQVQSNDTIEKVKLQSEKTDDFEAVEQEYKVTGIKELIVKDKIPDEFDDEEEEEDEYESEGDLSEIIEADEKLADDILDDNDDNKIDPDELKPSDKIKVDIKDEKTNIQDESIKNLSTELDESPDAPTVKRMIVTATSEDGGEEIEVCPSGSITFTKSASPDDSLRASPVKTTIDKDSLQSTESFTDKDSLDKTSINDSKTFDDSIEKSTIDDKKINNKDNKEFHLEVDSKSLEQFEDSSPAESVFDVSLLSTSKDLSKIEITESKISLDDVKIDIKKSPESDVQSEKDKIDMTLDKSRSSSISSISIEEKVKIDEKKDDIKLSSSMIDAKEKEHDISPIKDSIENLNAPKKDNSIDEKLKDITTDIKLLSEIDVKAEDKKIEKDNKKSDDENKSSSSINTFNVKDESTIHQTDAIEFDKVKEIFDVDEKSSITLSQETFDRQKEEEEEETLAIRKESISHATGETLKLSSPTTDKKLDDKKTPSPLTDSDKQTIISTDISPVEKISSSVNEKLDKLSDVKSDIFGIDRMTPSPHSEVVKEDDVKQVEAVSAESSKDISPARKESITVEKIDDKKSPDQVVEDKKLLELHDDDILPVKFDELQISHQSIDSAADHLEKEKSPSPLAESIKSAISSGPVSPVKDQALQQAVDDKKSSSPSIDAAKSPTLPQDIFSSEKDSLIAGEKDKSLGDVVDQKTPVSDGAKSAASSRDISPMRKESIIKDDKEKLDDIKIDNAKLDEKKIDDKIEDKTIDIKLPQTSLGDIELSIASQEILKIEKDKILSPEEKIKSSDKIQEKEKDEDIKKDMEQIDAISLQPIDTKSSLQDTKEDIKKLSVELSPSGLEDKKSIEEKIDTKSPSPSISEAKSIPSPKDVSPVEKMSLEKAVDVDYKKSPSPVVESVKSLATSAGDHSPIKQESPSHDDKIPTSQLSELEEKNNSPVVEIPKGSMSPENVLSIRKESLTIDDSLKLGQTDKVIDKKSPSPVMEISSSIKAPDSPQETTSSKSLTVDETLKLGHVDESLDIKSASPTGETGKSSASTRDVSPVGKDISLQNEPEIFSQDARKSIDLKLEDLQVDKKQSTSPIIDSIKPSSSLKEVTKIEQTDGATDKKSPSPIAESNKSSSPTCDILSVENESLNKSSPQSFDLNINNVQIVNKSPSPAESIKSSVSSVDISPVKIESLVHDEPLPSIQTPRQSLDIKLDEITTGNKSPSPIAESIKSSTSSPHDLSPIKKDIKIFEHEILDDKKLIQNDFPIHQLLEAEDKKIEAIDDKELSSILTTDVVKTTSSSSSSPQDIQADKRHSLVFDEAVVKKTEEVIVSVDVKSDKTPEKIITSVAESVTLSSGSDGIPTAGKESPKLEKLPEDIKLSISPVTEIIQSTISPQNKSPVEKEINDPEEKEKSIDKIKSPATSQDSSPDKKESIIFEEKEKDLDGSRSRSSSMVTEYSFDKKEDTIHDKIKDLDSIVDMGSSIILEASEDISKILNEGKQEINDGKKYIDEKIKETIEMGSSIISDISKAILTTEIKDKNDVHEADKDQDATRSRSSSMASEYSFDKKEDKVVDNKTDVKSNVDIIASKAEEKIISTTEVKDKLEIHDDNKDLDARSRSSSMASEISVDKKDEVKKEIDEIKSAVDMTASMILEPLKIISKAVTDVKHDIYEAEKDISARSRSSSVASEFSVDKKDGTTKEKEDIKSVVDMSASMILEPLKIISNTVSDVKNDIHEVEKNLATRSRSSSMASEFSVDLKDEKLKEKEDIKSVVDMSASMIIEPSKIMSKIGGDVEHDIHEAEKDIVSRSRSSSMASEFSVGHQDEKTERKEDIIKSKADMSSSMTSETLKSDDKAKHDIQEAKKDLASRSRSSSIASVDMKDEKTKEKLETKSTVDMSSSIIMETPKTTSIPKAKDTHEEENAPRSRSSSMASEYAFDKKDEKIDMTSSMIFDKPISSKSEVNDKKDIHDDDKDLASRSRSSSMASEFSFERKDEKIIDKKPTSTEMTSSIIIDTSKIISKPELEFKHDIHEEDKDLASRSRSSSMASELSHDKKDEKLDLKLSNEMSIQLQEETTSRSKRESLVSEAELTLKKTPSPAPSHHEDDVIHETPSRDRSRSHSLFESAEKLPIGRSRAASLFEDDIFTKSTSRKSSGLADFHEEHHTESSSKTIIKDDFEDSIANRKDVERYIISQYVSRKKKINKVTFEEIVSLYDVPSYIVIEIIHGICDEGRIRRESVIDSDLKVEDYSSEKIDNVKESEISYVKRIDTENYITDEYIRKNKKINWKIIEEISILKGINVNLILEIIEYLIVQRKITRESLIDDDVFGEQSIDKKSTMIKEVEKEEEEEQDDDDDGDEIQRQKSSRIHSDMEHSYPGELTPPEYDSRKENIQRQVFDDTYESQFHKAFVGGMTEIRTTHITTLSGKTTPDVGTRVDTPDSFTDSVASGTTEKILKETKIQSEPSSVKQTIVTEFQQQQQHQQQTEYETIVKRSDPIVIKRTIVTDEGPEYQTVVKTIEPTVIKRTVVNEDEPEYETQTIIKKTIVREVIEGDDDDDDDNEEIMIDDYKGISKAEIDDKLSQMMSKSLGQSSSGRSTPDRIRDSSVSRASTGTPDSFCSSEVIRTTITKTRTMSGDGEIITTTKEITETTNERGETVVLEEKIDVKTTTAETGTDTSQQQQHDDSEEKEDPLSGKSQIHHDKKIDFTTADMSSSFYGKLPDVPQEIGHNIGSESKELTIKTSTIEEKIESSSSTIKKTTEVGGVVKELKEEHDNDDDPLKEWGTPLKLPSPEKPQKFSLRTTPIARNSIDMSPDSLNFDVINKWGEPLRLPSPAPTTTTTTDDASNKNIVTTPKKEKKQPINKVVNENIKNNKKRSDSPAGKDKKKDQIKIQPVYLDLTYVPHHGNSYYASLDFFKRIRARYYVFSGTEPSREVYDALLDAKKTWENKSLEVTMIPTYDTDTLGYWVADNEEALAANHIDLSPSASRCTINLQDHETSCSAYRLEF